MEESNSRFRGRNVSDLSSNIIMLMIHGIVTNDLYVGDYIVHNKIYYRFAGFYKNKYAILVPDRVIGKSKNTFGNFIDTSKELYINKYYLPRALTGFFCEYPTLDAKLMTENDIRTLPLFQYNKSFIKDHFEVPYFLGDIKDAYTFKCINEHGRFDTVPFNAYIGVRPMIIIGESVFKSKSNPKELILKNIF